jgi:hypothetical protein
MNSPVTMYDGEARPPPLFSSLTRTLTPALAHLPYLSHLQPPHLLPLTLTTPLILSGLEA